MTRVLHVPGPCGISGALSSCKATVLLMLRYRHWLLPLVAVLAIVVGSLLNLDQVLPEHLIGDITNALHYPSGIILALIIGPLVGRSRRLAWAVWAGSLLLFAIIELVQPTFGRNCSLSDWLQSSTGMSLGMLMALITPQTPAYVKRLLAKVGIVLAVVFLVPLFHKIQTLDTHELRFPTLFTFEEDSELLLWKRYPATSMEHVQHGGIALEFQLSDQHFARVRYRETHYPAVGYTTVKKDWRGYRKLCFDSRGDQPDQILRVKLRDVVVPGVDTAVRLQYPNPVHWHNTCVELEGLVRKTGEAFDPSNVHSLVFIGLPRKEGGWFDIDNVKLVR